MYKKREAWKAAYNYYQEFGSYSQVAKVMSKDGFRTVRGKKVTTATARKWVEWYAGQLETNASTADIDFLKRVNQSNLPTTDKHFIFQLSL